jgi:polysaccharide deacetylase family protein (PEP-CTERM system associated)
LNRIAVMVVERGIEVARGLGPTSAIAGWHARPAEAVDANANALTIDVEDYFQVEAFFDVIDRSDWDGYDCRVEANIERILELLTETGARATFFTLGWIAERHPRIVRAIVGMGHELASHGSDHRRADGQTRAEFLADVVRAKALLEDLGGCEVKGYRAPSFSVSRYNLWVMEALAEAGYSYSSSTYPILHDNYGIPEGPRFAFHPLPERDFLEIPITSLRLFGRNWPCGGGGYFRLLPYGLSAMALARVNREGKPCVFYFHPWEVDPGQPRISTAPLKSRLRHYLNLEKTQTRLTRLLQEFRWRRMDEIFLPPAGPAS